MVLGHEGCLDAPLPGGLGRTPRMAAAAGQLAQRAY
jgi:hypothetical protein